MCVTFWFEQFGHAELGLGEVERQLQILLVRLDGHALHVNAFGISVWWEIEDESNKRTYTNNNTNNKNSRDRLHVSLQDGE